MLLYHFCINDSISPEPILRELISLEEAEIHFIAIAKKVSQFQNVQFKYRLIENLVFLLITDKSLRSLRLKLFDNYTRHNEQLLMSLFKDFSVNEPALLVFCFLAKQYFLITKLIVVMAQHETIIGDKSKSMLKMTNLLECPNLNHTRIDIHFDLYARKAFLCFLMAMPYCKYLKFLMQRLPLDDSEDQNKLSFRTIEEAEIKETQNLLLIY